MGPARRVSSNEKSRIQREVLQPYLLFLSLGKKKIKKEGVLSWKLAKVKQIVVY